MSDQILTVLKSKLDGLSAYGVSITDPETRLNALKEELQFYVLDFIYHHPEYSKWVMYGGSALRICYDLDRMSVDLDFEVSHKIENDFLNGLKEEAEKHFSKVYGIDSEFLKISITNNRSITLKFHAGSLIEGYASEWVHIKVDLNHFSPASGVVTERMPQNHGQLSFVIRTYNLSSLMASKIAAIFLRGTRGVGEATYEEKGRDIYDLLWYMGKKMVPDFDYLIAKGIDVKDPKALFDKITIKILHNPKTDENLKQDLLPLFVDRTFIENWLKNWRESYLRLLDDYKIRTVTELEVVEIHQDFRTDNFYFHYLYKTEEKDLVRITYSISDYWVDDVDLDTKVDKEIEEKIKFTSNGRSSKPAPSDKLKQYAALFHQKTEKYFKKTNRIILGDSIVTKLIRMTADNLNRKEQIVLNKLALLSCELDDLLK